MKCYKRFIASESFIRLFVFMNVLKLGFCFHRIGVRMCRSKCLDEEGCWSYKFSTIKLQCCLTTNCTSQEGFTEFGVRKVERDIKQRIRCPHVQETRRITTKMMKTICVSSTSRLPQIRIQYSRIMISKGKGRFEQLDLNSGTIEEYHVNIKGSTKAMVFSPASNTLYLVNSKGDLFAVQLGQKKTTLLLTSKFVTELDVDTKRNTLYLSFKEGRRFTICLYNGTTCHGIITVHSMIINIAVDWRKQNIFVRDISKIYGVTKNVDMFRISKLKFGCRESLEVDPDSKYLFFENCKFIMRFDIEQRKTKLIKFFNKPVVALLHDSRNLYIVAKGSVAVCIEKHTYSLLRKYTVSVGKKACLML